MFSRYCNFDLSNFIYVKKKVFGSILIFFYIKDVVRLVFSIKIYMYVLY